MLTEVKGRAALVALRRSGGGAALGRGYYKGGFEPKMTRREAALILEMPYVCHHISHTGSQTNVGQRTRHYKRTPTEEASVTHASEPPRSWRQPIPSDQSKRSERVIGEGSQVEAGGRCVYHDCTISWHNFQHQHGVGLNTIGFERLPTIV